jgi:hypothetical protein
MGICAVGLVLPTLPLQSVHFPQPVSAAASEFVGRFFSGHFMVQTVFHRSDFIEDYLKSLTDNFFVLFH